MQRFNQLKYRLNLLLLSTFITLGFSPMTLVSAQNLTQDTANKITAEGLTGIEQAIRYIAAIIMAVGFLLSFIALGINAYYQSKAIQQGNSSQTQQELKQMGKLLKNIALFAFIIGVFSAAVYTILSVAYGDIFSA